MEWPKTVIFYLRAGLVWSALLLVVAGGFVRLPVFALMPTIMTAYLAPGLVMMAMVARVSWARFSDDDGVGQDRSIDHKVLMDTVTQMVLALAVWPAAAVLLGAAGPGTILMLGLGLALALMLFWIGAHRSAKLKAFGFSASFCPTLLVALWAGVGLVI